MNRFLWLLCAPLTGCAGSVVGEWEGDCKYTVGGNLLTYEVAIEVDDVKKGDINGTAQVIATEAVSKGVLDGQQDGKDLTLEIEFTDGVNEGEVLELIGEVSGREILGDFTLGGHTGDCELERDN